MSWNSGMAEIVSNTSPLLYLYRIQVLDWLPALGGDVWIPRAVELELEEGRRRGYDVPDPDRYDWLRVVDPNVIPSEWLIDPRLPQPLRDDAGADHRRRSSPERWAWTYNRADPTRCGCGC